MYFHNRHTFISIWIKWAAAFKFNGNYSFVLFAGETSQGGWNQTCPQKGKLYHCCNVKTGLLTYFSPQRTGFTTLKGCQMERNPSITFIFSKFLSIRSPFFTSARRCQMVRNKYSIKSLFCVKCCLCSLTACGITPDLYFHIIENTYEMFYFAFCLVLFSIF